MGYLGSKAGSGVYQAIIALMPPHDTYVEPFAGSAAIFQRKAACRNSILVDLDDAAPCWALNLAANVAAERGVDALAWLESFDPAGLGRVVIYADPPYLLETRTSSKRYAHEFTIEDHRRLAAALCRLAALGVAVIVSGYRSALYDELYAGWATVELQAMTRGGVRTEKLWLNFAPGAVHWATFAGRNFTERQRIKRKAARWAAMFAALPHAERLAVLAALLATEADRA